MASLRKTMLARGGSKEEMNKVQAEELARLNPKLKEYTPYTRLAYAKFKALGAAAAKKNAEVAVDLEEGKATTEATIEVDASPPPKPIRQKLLDAVKEVDAQKVEAEETNILEERAKLSPLPEFKTTEKRNRPLDDEREESSADEGEEKTPRTPPPPPYKGEQQQQQQHQQLLVPSANEEELIPSPLRSPRFSAIGGGRGKSGWI